MERCCQRAIAVSRAALLVMLMLSEGPSEATGRRLGRRMPQIGAQYPGVPELHAFHIPPVLCNCQRCNARVHGILYPCTLQSRFFELFFVRLVPEGPFSACFQNLHRSALLPEDHFTVALARGKRQAACHGCL